MPVPLTVIVEAGGYSFTAIPDGLVRRLGMDVAVVSGQVRELHFQPPATAHVEGRLLLPPGADLSGCHLDVEGAESFPGSLTSFFEDQVTLDPVGTFALEPVEVGTRSR